MEPSRSRAVIFCGCLLMASIGSCFVARAGGLDQGASVNQDALLVVEFQRRVADYVKLHKDIAAHLPPLKPTDSQAKITEYQRTLARELRTARPNAKQGNIFSTAIAGEFRRLLKIAMQSPDAGHIRASLQRGEPAKTRIHVVVNGSYPSTVPLQTSPPSLLANLPQLPPEVEYRVAGHDLVLRDILANLIVDLVPGAVP